MSRTPNSRKEETHDRIVRVAARAIRRQGYAGVGVAEVMAEAGLTHGGFYAHFGSKDALLVEALQQAGRESHDAMAHALAEGASQGRGTFRVLVETYLDDTLLRALGAGCPVAALGSEMPRQSEALRAASAARVRGLIASVATRLPEAHRAAAGTVSATLVGALQLARALGDNAEGRAVLASARVSLIRQFEPTSP